MEPRDRGGYIRCGPFRYGNERSLTDCKNEILFDKLLAKTNECSYNTFIRNVYVGI